MAMQFLQTGIATDDRCLFITTEQSPQTLRQSFQNYGWQLDRSDLGLISVTAQPGTVDGDQALTLETDGENRPFDAFPASRASEYITRYVTEFAPVDRVVLDSAGALATSHLKTTPQPTLVDLHHVFTTEFNAATIYTTDDHEAIQPLPYLVASTLALDRETVAGTEQYRCQIQALDGSEYDPRPVTLQFGTDGVTAAPTTRGLPTQLTPHDHVTTGISGLDTLLGGGLMTGAGSLLRHDGQAPIAPLVSAILAALHEQDYALTLLPPLGLRPDPLAELFSQHDLDMRSLLNAGDLYVVDFVGAWDTAESNIYGATDDRSQLEGVLREVDELTEGRRATIASADVLSHAFSPDDVRALRYYQEGQLLGNADVLLNLQNPSVVDDTIAAFFQDTADQVFRTAYTPDGRQFTTVKAAPSGYIGSSALTEHHADPPYITIEPPPQPQQSSIENGD